jgi:hypothetical protein
MSLIGALTKALKVGEPAKKTAPFYSSVDEALANIARPKGTGAEFYTELTKQPGVKKAELADRKLEQAFKAKGKMTKEEAQQVLKENPSPQIKERVSDDKFIDEDAFFDSIAQELYGKPYYKIRNQAQEDHVFNVAMERMESGFGTKYSTYKTPGGENYREILLKLPETFTKQDFDRLLVLQAQQRQGKMTADKLKELGDLEAKKQSGPSNFIGQHWDDPNVLAHMRVQDRAGPNGEKILHVEEIQSDWHQKGRKGGYANEPAYQEARQKADEVARAAGYQDAFHAAEGWKGHGMKSAKEASDLLDEASKFKSVNSVPDAPFKKNWHELAMKRLLNYAADNGYDSIAVTPGAEQAKRFDLTRVADAISYHPDEKGRGMFLNVFGKNNNLIYSKLTPESELPNVIGQETTQKLLQQAPDDGNRVLSGLDLELGGEGMKGFYDKIIPDYLNTFGKQYGAQVGLQTIDVPKMINVGSGAQTEVGRLQIPLHNFPITPEMRQQIQQKGLPLYQQVAIPTAGAASQLPEFEFEEPKAKGGAIHMPKNASRDTMWLATQEQKFQKGGKVTQMLTEGLEALGITKRGMEGVKQLSAEEKAVLEKWGQKQAQEAERAKKVEKMAKDSAKKSPEDSVKPAKASTGKRTATPPDFYRKMAETQGDEAVLRAARAGKHLKPDTSGGYVGAPRTVDSPQALGKMRRDLDQDFIDSVDAVRLADPVRLGTWYDRAKSGMAQMTEPYQLPRTLEQHGVYSAGVAPESELTFALKHLNSRNYGEPKMAYRGAGMRTLDRAVAADEPAEMGFKIGEYADKNDPRLPNTGLFGVNDFRRAQGMGYTDPQGNPWKAGVSDTMHPFMDLETALQVDRANKAATGGRSDWYGPHIQELPWVYGKAQDLYSRGSSKTGRYGGDPLEGIKMALQDANKTAIDYAYKHAGSATHEAIPGPNTGHVPSILNAPLDERIAYTNTGRWDRPVPEAALNEFPEVGAGNRDAIYSALGYRQLPTLDASGAFLPEGATAYDMQPVKIARPLLDFPTGGEGLIAPDTKQLMDFSERFRALNDAQEAFGYNLPNTMGDVTGKNSLMLDTRRLNPNRNLDPATGVQPSTEQMGALTAALDETGYGIAPTSRGATIFPYDPSATTKDINKLLKSKRAELEGIYPSDIETSLNSSGFGPGVGKYTPEGFTASEPFSGQATKGLLKEASYLPQSAIQNLSESEFVRQAIKEKMRRDAALPGARADIQNTRQFFAEADWAKAVELIRRGMSPTAALAALGYSASSMAGEADR